MITVSYLAALAGISAWLLLAAILAVLSFRFGWAGWSFLVVLLIGIAFAVGFTLRGSVVWPAA